MSQPMTRRTFLTATTAAAGATAGLLALPRHTPAAPPVEVTNLAIVGDMYVAGHFFSAFHIHDLRIVALCNPDTRQIAPRIDAWADRADELAQSDHEPDRDAAPIYQKLAQSPPPTFADFREMFAEAGDDIHAVIVSMFDHQHGPICAEAMRRGIHVFSERPLGLTAGESAALARLAAQTGVATAIRNPGSASSQFRRGVELIRDGLLGPVTDVHVYFDRPGADRSDPPQQQPPVPDGLHWDLWLGPAAQRPYHPDWMNYAQWRDFSNGNIGTFGPHTANLAFMALNLHKLWDDNHADAAIRVQAECPTTNRISFPAWERVRWDVPARGDMPPATFTWHGGEDFGPDARDTLRQLLAEHADVTDVDRADDLLGYAGCLIIGKNGVMVADDHNVHTTFLPEDKFRDVERDQPQQLPASTGLYRDWLRTARGDGPKPLVHFEYAATLSQFLMLANVATQFPEQRLAYAPVANRITNHDQADQSLSYDYRDGWTL